MEECTINRSIISADSVFNIIGHACSVKSDSIWKALLHPLIREICLVFLSYWEFLCLLLNGKIVVLVLK